MSPEMREDIGSRENGHARDACNQRNQEENVYHSMETEWGRGLMKNMYQIGHICS